MGQGGRRKSGAQRAAIPRCLIAPICCVLAKVLRELREARHLSRYEVAKRAGISRSMVSYIEKGLGVPTVDMVARLCGVYGLRLSRLFSRAERQR